MMGCNFNVVMYGASPVSDFNFKICPFMKSYIHSNLFFDCNHNYKNKIRGMGSFEEHFSWPLYSVYRNILQGTTCK